MATIKQTITNELLDSIDDPSGLEAVFERGSRTKGPFYLALAEATFQIQQRLRQAGEDLSDLENRKSQLQELVEAFESRHGELEVKVQGLNDEIAISEERLTQAEVVLDKANALEAQGFGEEELARLS